MPATSQDSEDWLLLKYHLEKWWVVYTLVQIIPSYFVIGIINIISFELFLSLIFWKIF